MLENKQRKELIEKHTATVQSKVTECVDYVPMAVPARQKTNIISSKLGHDAAMWRTLTPSSLQSLGTR